MTSETNPSFNFRFGYTGRERDKESDLMYYRARYFDPATGTFVGEDPLGFAAGDANLYRYVFNSPTNFIDPSGLSGEIPYGQIAKETAIGIGAALAGIYQSGKNIVNEWNNRPRQTQTPNSVEAISTPDLPGASAFPTTVAGNPADFDPNEAQRQPQARPQTDSLTPPTPRPTPGTSEDFNPNRINDKTHSHPNSRGLIWPGGFCPAPWLNGDSDTDGLDRDWFESNAEKPYAGQTPTDDPDGFIRIPRTPAKQRKDDGSVWEKDFSQHGGSTWKRWRNRKDWEKDRNRESVRDDGSVR